MAVEEKEVQGVISNLIDISQMAEIQIKSLKNADDKDNLRAIKDLINIEIEKLSSWTTKKE